MTLDALFETAGAKIPDFAESKETITYPPACVAASAGRWAGYVSSFFILRVRQPTHRIRPQNTA